MNYLRNTLAELEISIYQKSSRLVADEGNTSVAIGLVDFTLYKNQSFIEQRGGKYGFYMALMPLRVYTSWCYLLTEGSTQNYQL